MIGHQAVRVTNPVESSHHFGQHVQKALPVFIILVDRLPSIASRSDVIKGT